MNTRRTFLMTLTAGLVALAVLAAPVIAEELLGVITKVDVAGKKLTVTPKGEDKDVEITITDDTEVVSKKAGNHKVTTEDLEKIAANVKKAQDAGKKGAFAKIEHEKGKASKIQAGGGFAKKKDNN